MNLKENCGDEEKRGIELLKLRIDTEDSTIIVDSIKKRLDNINDALIPLVFQTVFTEIRQIRRNIENPYIPLFPLPETIHNTDK